MAHKLNGIKLIHLKGTQNSETLVAPVPKKAILPMAMSMGAPCEPLVKAGDEVFVGQKIGDSPEFFSLPVHASVSGKVTAIGELLLSNGKRCKTVEIESDHEQKLFSGIKKPEINSKEDFCAAVKEGGICGLGGAGFPTHLKLTPKNEIDTLIINAAECEPYITSDCREILEHPEDVIGGIELVMKWLNIPKAIVAIEGNKPEAIELMHEKTSPNDNIVIFELPERYPQGAEKVIIYTTTGRIVMEGQLPSDTGCIVLNVSTTAEIKRYCETGIPLTKRRVTVEGDCLAKPCNIEACIGTPASELLAIADANLDAAKRIVFGGLMMGACQVSPDYPIIKTSNAVLALSTDINDSNETACIRCGCCIRTCPLGLMPTDIEKAYKTRNIEALKKLKVTLCMNCGSCTYACPAHRKLAETNQLAKSMIPRK